MTEPGGEETRCAAVKWGEAIAEAFAGTREAALEMTDTEQGKSNIALGRELERKVKGRTMYSYSIGSL